MKIAIVKLSALGDIINSMIVLQYIKNINPEIEVLNDTTEPYDEGCLSVPGFYETVARPSNVMISALDREGKPFKEKASGLLAICIQHEIDHLEGKLFVDYLSPLKRQIIRKKMKKKLA